MIRSAILMLVQAVRRLTRSPGFAFLAVLMLTLGIASTTAIFSLISGVLLTPPPYEEPEDLVFVSTATAANRDQAGIFNWPEQLWTEWLAGNESFESIAGYRWAFNFLVSNDGSEALEGMLVSEGYFSVIAVEPQLGRAFTEADSNGTENPAIILGHDLWQSRFNGDPDIIGQTVTLSRWPSTTIVGVMPPDVRFLPSPGVASEPNYNLHEKVDYWLPIPPQMREQPAWNAIARLKPGVTTTEAEAEVAVLLARYRESVPEIEGLGARLDPLNAVLNADAERLLLPLLAAAALVLLIACGNATALLLIRGLQRQHEYGLRTAIGAGSGRLFGLVIGEAVVLAVISGTLGILLALALVRLFTAVSGDAIPRIEDVAIGWQVLAFGIGAALIACLIASLAPAMRVMRLNPVDALRLGGQKSSDTRTQRRLLGTVVIAQAALTLALLVGAGLLIRTMMNLDVVRPGYDTRNLLTMSVTAVDGEWQDFHQRALERVTALPGVEGAAFAWGVPLTGNAWASRIEIQDYDPPDPTDAFVALPIRAVTNGYFEMLNQPVVVGRDFRASDGPNEPDVAIVNQNFVEQYFGGGDAIGKTVWPRGRDGGLEATIVGVIADSRTNDLTAAAEPELYLTLWQASAFSKHLVVRSTASAEVIAGSVRAALRDIAPTVAIENIKTLDDIRGESLASRNFATQLLIGFAVIACVLTLGGVYSVLSLTVATRRREIAIRAAVGAERARLLGFVMKQGLKMIVVGAAAGVIVSIALSRLLQSWLFGVNATDPLTLLGATALFVLFGLITCWVPAQRASAIEPVEALRAE
jgi:putative ABC transport system permease protein